VARATPDELLGSDLAFYNAMVPFTQGGFGSIYRCYFKKDGDWRLCIGKKAKCDADDGSLCHVNNGLEMCQQVCSVSLENVVMVRNAKALYQHIMLS